MDTGVALRALRSTSIISYSRPVTPSNGTEPVKKLKVADLPALKLTAEEARLHQHVVEVLRHKIIAHSDNDFRQVTKVIVKGWGGNPEVRFQQQEPTRPDSAAHRGKMSRRRCHGQKRQSAPVHHKFERSCCGY